MVLIISVFCTLKWIASKFELSVHVIVSVNKTETENCLVLLLETGIAAKASFMV